MFTSCLYMYTSCFPAKANKRWGVFKKHKEIEEDAMNVALWCYNAIVNGLDHLRG